MTNASLGELYFIIGMMALILIICVVATYVFFRQFRREKGVNSKDGNIDTKSDNDSE